MYAVCVCGKGGGCEHARYPFEHAREERSESAEPSRVDGRLHIIMCARVHVYLNKQTELGLEGILVVRVILYACVQVCGYVCVCVGHDARACACVFPLLV
jgi:hypothetical protein